MGRLMGEENGWDHGVSARVGEGPVGCIGIGEVAAALKGMKGHRAHQVCRGWWQR